MVLVEELSGRGGSVGEMDVRDDHLLPFPLRVVASRTAADVPMSGSGDRPRNTSQFL